MSTVVCAFDRCRRPPCPESGVLCERHYDIVKKAVPDRLEKRDGSETILDADRLTRDELKAVAIQVERDALPLFLAAWNWCGVQALRNVLPRPA